MPYFSGYVDRVIYSNEPNGFYIFNVTLNQQKGDSPYGDSPSAIQSRKVTVKGHLMGMTPVSGFWLAFEAKWVNHPSYGRQLEILRAPVKPDPLGIEEAALILRNAGVPLFVMEEVRKKLGDTLVEVLETPGALIRMKILEAQDALYIEERWAWMNKYFETIEFLADAQVPKTWVPRIWSCLGPETAETLRTNPWYLVSLEGFSFKLVDELGWRLGFPKNDPNRMKALVVEGLRDGSRDGHCYLSSKDLWDRICKTPGVETKPFGKAIREVVSGGAVAKDRLNGSGDSLWLPELQEAEKGVANHLCNLLGEGYSEIVESKLYEEFYAQKVRGRLPEYDGQEEPSLGELARSHLLSVTGNLGVDLTDRQFESLEQALVESVSVITGPPGTGKTFCLKVLVQALKRLGVHTTLLAPTGVAARRLSDLTGERAFTIHKALRAKSSELVEDKSLLSYFGNSSGSGKGSEFSWGFNPRNPMMVDCVIVDEFSMVDIQLLWSLIQGVHPSAKFVFVGDAEQLPSVGPGSVLRDMIRCRVVPVKRFREIFRQKEAKRIIVVSHDILNGRVPETGPDVSTDFRLVETKNHETSLAVIEKVVVKLSEKKSPVSYQVLSPRYAGPLGVRNLNNRLRNLLNPKRDDKMELRVGEESVRSGDRVMIIKNDYQREVCNGDIGEIIQISRSPGEVRVDLEGGYREAVFKMSEVQRFLRLAYACTVHKYQGQEVDVIVMPIVEDFGIQLQRNILYTAVTRAKLRVILVGSLGALRQAIQNDEQRLRNTGLVERLSVCMG